jgi:alpha/beta superfamily hydrolase
MRFRPPAPERIAIPGPAGPLEALLEEAAGAVPHARFGVLCHPHPLYGGTMDNKVVHTLARAFQELGMPTVRFNFRGVGASAGAHAGGVGEVDDALAVIEWGRARWPGAAVWLAGFSFGAAVALRASSLAPVARLVTVAPPVGRLLSGDVAVPRCPWLLLQGTADELVDAAAVRDWASRLVPPPDIVELSGASHFFHGRLHELRDAVLAHAGPPASAT